MNHEGEYSPTPNADAVEQWLRSIRISNQQSGNQDTAPVDNHSVEDSNKPNALKTIGDFVTGVFKPHHRYDLIMTDDFYDCLANMAKEEHVSLAEIVRRAVASYSYLKREEMAGDHVALTDYDDNILKIVNLP